MSAATTPVLGFHHPGVVVSNLDDAIGFYSQLLGYELISESSWEADNAGFNQVVGLERSAARFCMLKGKNAYLELFEYTDAQALSNKPPSQANEPGIRHLAFVVSDIGAVLDQCVALGGSRINEPVLVPGRAAAAYCRDPFGNLLEFVTPMGSFPQALGL